MFISFRGPASFLRVYSTSLAAGSFVLQKLNSHRDVSASTLQRLIHIQQRGTTSAHNSGVMTADADAFTCDFRLGFAVERKFNSRDVVSEGRRQNDYARIQFSGWLYGVRRSTRFNFRGLMKTNNRRRRFGRPLVRCHVMSHRANHAMRRHTAHLRQHKLRFVPG